MHLWVTFSIKVNKGGAGTYMQSSRGFLLWWSSSWIIQHFFLSLSRNTPCCAFCVVEPKTQEASCLLTPVKNYTCSDAMGHQFSDWLQDPQLFPENSISLKTLTEILPNAVRHIVDVKKNYMTQVVRVFQARPYIIFINILCRLAILIGQKHTTQPVLNAR